MVKVSRYSLKERLNLAELYQTFLGYSLREQIIFLAGGAFVLLLIIIIPLSFASSKLGKLESQITNYEKDVKDVTSKISEYKKAQATLNQVEKNIQPKSQVQLTTRLESLATKTGIGNNIDSLKEKPGTPGEDFEELAVDVNMSKLSLSQIIEFMFEIESQKDLSLKVNRMELKPRYDNRQQFDVNFEVTTLVTSQSG